MGMGGGNPRVPTFETVGLIFNFFNLRGTRPGWFIAVRTTTIDSLSGSMKSEAEHEIDEICIWRALLLGSEDEENQKSLEEIR